MLTIRQKRLWFGYGCLFIGFIGGILPIFQGWVFIALGLLLLKEHAPWARFVTVWIKKKFPKIRPSFSKADDKIEAFLARFNLSEVKHKKTPKE